jgi:hypothetical protein
MFHTHMLQVYVPNVSSASDLCCIQVFNVACVSCFRGLFRESWGTTCALGEGPWQAGGTADGVRDAPRVLWTGRAHPYPGSRPCGERGGGQGEGAAGEG